MPHVEHISFEQFDPSSLERGAKRSMLLRFDDSETESGVIPVNVVTGTEDGPTLLVLAAVHGDEYEGVRALIELYRAISPDDLRGTLITVPVVNVSSYRSGTRTSGTDGRNLAREFPGSPTGTYTQKLAHALDCALIARADFLLDLHSGGSHYAMPLMVGYYENEQSEIGRKSKAAAEAFGIDVMWGHEEVAPGRTVSAATDRGIPWLYIEGYGGKRIREQELKHFYEGTLRLLDHLQMLRNPGVWIDCPANPVACRMLGEGDLDQAPVARHDGFFIPSVRLLDRVSAGQTIGMVYDWFGSPLQEVQSQQDGYVMMLREVPYTRLGDGLYALAAHKL
jgi:predicted deacylase